jgi:GntR family transcriptional regulator, transcriptional repressor for pyruvate dehydrogenase complex
MAGDERSVARGTTDKPKKLPNAGIRTGIASQDQINGRSRSTPADARSLVERAMDHVIGYIRSNDLRVGDSLPGESHFSNALGVSRTVMREAYRSLAALHLIDVQNGRKPKVRAFGGDVLATTLNHALSTAQVSMYEIWDVRRMIELKTAALASQLRTDDEAQHILYLADAIAESYDDPELVVGLDVEFHEAIAAASKNVLLEQIMKSLKPMMRLVVPVAWKTRVTQAEKRKVIRNHRAIAKAIATRDALSAKSAMEAHFDATVGALLLRFTRSNWSAEGHEAASGVV